jgi:spore coat polysaccharide biosynthesis predicted glycosyltransferase SpsG
VKRVLISFGGVDEGNITLLTCKAISQTCIEKGIHLEIIIGPAYAYEEKLNDFINSKQGLSCNVIRHTKKISEHMNQSDVAITSGGRTVLELASLKVPTIVICQNERETTHTFASSENGIINLGHRKNVSAALINDSLNKVISDHKLRELMIKKVSELNLNKGKARVISKIKSIIHE